jgi:glutamate synthase (NADPH/NADH) small chain
MGKTTGFLDYRRLDNPMESPQKRITSFQEFHRALSAEKRMEQGARCMNCGVPFCQSAYGCPLHNLIPEWNDEIFAGNWSHALSRLLKINSFPEFTGRVCPALCENACICGMDDLHNAVTIRENELFVSEYAWANGLIKPEIPAVRTGKHVAVVGSGPSGLAVSDLLNRRGHSVTVYERDDTPVALKK